MELLWFALFVIFFIPGTVLWYYGMRALGRATKTAVTERPVETMRWIKFFVDICRK